MMTEFRFRALGAPQLLDGAGSSRVHDSLALGFLAMLAVAGPAGVEESELMLRLTPALTPGRARVTLDRLVSEVEQVLGPGAVARQAARIALAPGRVAPDVAFGTPDGRPLPPSDAARFLEGFSLPDAPEFTEWVEAARSRLVDCRPAPARGTSHKAKWAALAGVLALVTVAMFITRTETVASFTPGQTLVLADVVNRTGDTLFDKSLQAAATIALQQSAHIRIMPRGRVREALQRMQVADPDTALTPELAREVAARENVGFALVLEIDRQGEGYQLSATLSDVESGRTLTKPTASAETQAGVLIALDRILLEIRARTGEPSADRAQRSLPLPQVTTPSLAALRSYALGAQAWGSGKYLLAKELWERSLDLDSGFAMAYGALGSYRYYLHDREAGEQFFREALRRRNRLTESEQLRLDVSYATWRGDRDSAVRGSKFVAERYPGADTWYSYGTVLMQSGRYPEAIAALKESLKFDSTRANTWINLATSTKAPVADKLEYYERAAQIDTTVLLHGNINTEYGSALIESGRYDDARRNFERMLPLPGLFERALGHRGLGFLAIWQGKTEEAVRHFRDATEASRQQNSPLSEARGRIFEALALLFAGDTAAAVRALGDLDRLVQANRFEPEMVVLAGHAMVRANKLAFAERVLARIHETMDTARQIDREAERFLDASTLLLRGRAAEAAARLTGFRRYPQQHLLVVRRAEALAALGRTDSAAAIVDSLINAGPKIGSESMFDWLLAHRLLGDWRAQLHQRARAEKAYRELIDLWANGDSTAGLLASTRARLRALQSSNDRR